AHELIKWPEEPIPLVSSVQHKFYEPIILFEALNFASRDTVQSASQSELLDVREPEQLFHAFVYKLAHLCDYKKRGTTVTSFMILQGDPSTGAVRYKFAVNQQRPDELEKTRHYVESLLKKVDQLVNVSSGRLQLRAKIHRDVLIFNKPRITLYLKQLEAQVEDCRTICNNNESEDNTSISAGLANIESSMQVNLGDRVIADATFADEAQAVIDELQEFQKSPAGQLIADRARESRTLTGYPRPEWELQHTISRLVAYTVSVQFLIQARKMWPRLFKGFDVSFVPSSQPAPRVFRNKSGSAEGIINRMTSKAKILQTFKAFVNDLQGFDLNARILEQYQNPKFKPIVHSELLLLNWLQNSGGIRPERFFNDWMYIGASKPTCRLCHYYVEEHPSAVKVRPTHGNIYTNWRVPDVLPADGPEAITARDTMVDRMLRRVRDDAFDMVKQKVPSSYKQQVISLPCYHDSNTFSARLTALDTTTVQGSSVAGDFDDLASRLGDMGLGD
ncbi:hypothetical protein PG984_007324, partial [Apiospora sp. TS-2023a]